MMKIISVWYRQRKKGDYRAADIIKNWIRNRTTLEFLGTWEQMYNLDFKVVEFDHFKNITYETYQLIPSHRESLIV